MLVVSNSCSNKTLTHLNKVVDSLEVEKVVVRDVDTDAEIEPSISAEIINGPKLGHNSALISKFDNQI